MAGGRKENYDPYTVEGLKDAEAREALISCLAGEVIRLTQSSIVMSLRFMDNAVFRLKFSEKQFTGTLATDGRYLFYNPEHILRRYRISDEVIARDYLHMVLHCVFRHPFIGKDVQHRTWSLACDIFIENLINKLDIPCARTRKAEDIESVLSFYRERIHPFTAEKIYAWLMKDELIDTEYEQQSQLFFADDHSLWYPAKKEKDEKEKKEEAADDEDRADEEGGEETEAPGSGGASSEDDNENGSENPGEGAAVNAPADGDSGEGQSGYAPSEDGDKQASMLEPDISNEDLDKIWEDIGRRIQVDMETSTRSYGNGDGGLLQELKRLNREKFDYRAFLKRFMTLGENIEVNDEEFDYIFYTYGMEHYDRMPLIEPLEYKEVKKIREFVICIDTSESVAGDLVQTFVNKTWNILKQEENFFTKVNIHIIQCAAGVQSDVKITSSEELDEYMQNMQLFGFGGTDFRPAFKHVDRLLEKGEFTNLKGVIYFTDGYGAFPEKKPEYESVFLFCREETDMPEVPAWAIRMVLTPDEIREI